MKKLLIVFLSLMLIVITRPSSIMAESTDSDWVSASEFRDTTYYRTLNKWLSEGKKVILLNSEITFPLTVSGLDTVNIQNSTKEMYLLKKDKELVYKITVNEAGLYQIGFNYYASEQFYSKPYIDIYVNNESQFNEMNNLELEVDWDIIERTEEEKYNRYGNELLPHSVAALKLYKYYLSSQNSYYATPYKFYLKEGENEIRIKLDTYDLYFGELFLYNDNELKSYDEYFTEKNSNSKGEIITIQGEDFVSKNDLEIKSTYYKEPSIKPFEYKHTILNILDGSSVSRGGTQVTYSFEVKKTGYYNIAFKYLKNTNMGVASGKRILIDGKVPFKELECYLFDSARKWVNHTLGENDNAYAIYLEEGTHTLTIESTTIYATEIIDRLNYIADWINSTALTVKNITGGSVDNMISWNIVKYLPTLEKDLYNYANEIEKIYNYLEKLDNGVKSAPELSSLKVAVKQLRKIAEQPNKLNTMYAEFSDGSGSAYQLIGIVITALLNVNLSIDQIYVYNDVKLPSSTANIFKKIWIGIKSFIYSFFDTRYKLANTEDEDTLEVWVGQSSMYLDIIQSMIDDGFTKQTGIKVKASVLPATSKIVLSNSTNDNPDVVLGIDVWEPYNYALRGILEDLSKYPGFAETVEYIEKNNFAPIIYEDGVYGIPETQGLYLLYYRTDILNFLDLDVPETWDDVIAMLKYLQSYQMNFFSPLGGDNSYKSYGYVSPFIYQFGGEIYRENAMMSTLTDEATIKAITFMTDLFNIYNLPQQVSSFFEHFRTGDLPIGISSIDLYLQLKYAAPEIAGQWSVTTIPGMYKEESGEVEKWSPSYGKASILFSNTTDKLKEYGWELIKWWNQTDVQVDFVKNIKMSLGERYLVVPANTKALELSIWDENIKDALVEQAKWGRIPAVTPGSYIVERELSQIWNKIVIDKVPVRIAIDESIPKINRELQRKLEEFGYLKNGIVVKPYKVPVNSNIEDWFGGKDE